MSIYHEPLDGKAHPCARPFDRGRSAQDRPDGASPVCLVTEVTSELLADFRTNEQSRLR